MKKLFVIVAALFFVCASAFGQDYEGTLDNAPYKIRVPSKWNRELLLYAHGYGYIERWDIKTQFDYSYADAAPGGKQMEDFLLSQGYALAGSVFNGTGWQVKEGTLDTAVLLGLFLKLVGKPKRTILIGYSLGSLIALKSAEQVPVYNGIIAGCTAGAGASRSMDLVGAFSLAYATLFGWPSTWGTWDKVRNDINFNQDVLPALYAQAMDPTNIPKFEFIRLLTAAPPEGFYSDPGWLFLDMFMATEVRADLQIRAGGPVVQNANAVYTLSAADKAYLTAIGFAADQIDAVLAAMNAQTAETVSPSPQTYLTQYFDPSGDLQRPVISLHAVKDGMVPVYEETVLNGTVQAAGKASLLQQVYTGDAGHCTFTPTQLLDTIRAMDSWLDTGIKPGPGFFPEADGFIPGYVPPLWPIGTK